jgi:peptide/nickel transport system permease protein
MLAKLDYILKRLVMSALVLLGLSIITFTLARVVPSDPAALYVGPRARPEQVEAMRIKLGLDKPLPVQYLYYLWDALHGDLGTSITSTVLMSEVAISSAALRPIFWPHWTMISPARSLETG